MIKNFYMFTNCSNSCPFYVKYILYNKAIASENLLNPSHQIHHKQLLCIFFSCINNKLFCT